MLNAVHGSQSASVFRIGQAINGYEQIKGDLENLPERLGQLSHRWQCYRVEFRQKEVDPAETDVAELLDSEAKEFATVLSTIKKIQETYIQLQTAIESCGVSAKKPTDYTGIGENEIKEKLPIIGGKLQNICTKITTLTNQINQILPIAKQNLERTFFHANNLEDPTPRTPTTVLKEKLSNLVWTSPPPRYSLEKALQELAEQTTTEEPQTTLVEAQNKSSLRETTEDMSYKQELEILETYNERLDNLSKLKPSIKFPLRPITQTEVSIPKEVTEVKKPSTPKGEAEVKPTVKDPKLETTKQAEPAKQPNKATQTTTDQTEGKKNDKPAVKTTK